MKLYSKKQQWKQILFLVGLVIIVAIVWLTSLVVNNVKKAELEKIQLWSQAIKKKAELVRLTNEAFEKDWDKMDITTCNLFFTITILI